MKNHNATPPAKKQKLKPAATFPSPVARAPFCVRRPQCPIGGCKYPQPCCVQSLQPPR